MHPALRHILFSKKKAVVEPVSFTTWNPVDKGADLVLSNGDLTAAYTAVAGYQNVKSLANASSGKKKYFEWRSDFQQTFGLPGICNSSQSMNGEFLGGTANSVGFLSSGAVFLSPIPMSVRFKHTRKAMSSVLLSTSEIRKYGFAPTGETGIIMGPPILRRMLAA